MKLKGKKAKATKEAEEDAKEPEEKPEEKPKKKAKTEDPKEPEKEAVPKKKAKDKDAEAATPKEPLTPQQQEEKKRLTTEAINVIRDGISKPGAQQDGITFVPHSWSFRFKPLLGPYKQFVLGYPEKFAIIPHLASGNFIVRPAGAQVPQTAPVNMPWKKEMSKAWTYYCQAVKRGQRDFAEFLSALPKAGEKGMPVTPSSPDAVPMPDPDESPSPMRKRGKRRKASADVDERPGGKKKRKRSREEEDDDEWA
mmetsp:Transcript_1680/g.3758  ORF Transcript_1680/g.3758 Transcript_1680/m.3758 type:complete len:253 (+) Transcript_1680:79-837(+)